VVRHEIVSVIVLLNKYFSA